MRSCSTAAVLAAFLVTPATVTTLALFVARACNTRGLWYTVKLLHDKRDVYLCITVNTTITLHYIVISMHAYTTHILEHHTQTHILGMSTNSSSQDR